MAAARALVVQALVVLARVMAVLVPGWVQVQEVPEVPGPVLVGLARGCAGVRARAPAP